MKRSTDRILTTHVGSIVRPQALLDRWDANDGTPAAKSAFEQELARSVESVVRQQLEGGIDIVNDGEYGKSGWANYFYERSTGFEVRENELTEYLTLGKDRFRFTDAIEQTIPDVRKGLPVDVCVGPIVYTGHEEIKRDLANLKAAA